MNTQLFVAVSTLQKRLPSSQELEVFHSGHILKTSFQWSKPADPKYIQDRLTLFNGLLPKDYVSFLEEISDGAILFYDILYGQWGFELYGTEKLVAKQKQWEKSFPNKWSSRFIAFGELFGEANVMVFDLSKPSQNQISYAVVEADALDPIEYWPLASRSFNEWLNHLITAQGDKYWLWR